MKPKSMPEFHRPNVYPQKVTFDLCREINMDGKVAWRMFLKQITAVELKNHITVIGRKDLADKLIEVVAVMA